MLQVAKIMLADQSLFQLIWAIVKGVAELWDELIGRRNILELEIVNQ